MVRVNLAQAKARLDELVEQVEAGEDILITRDGRPVAQISAVLGNKATTKEPVDFEALAKFRSSLPKLSTSSAELIRQMRDEGY
jgi:antitoxin (DNA-binding transcriptional repressor) of toxin-antitoxin stability system